MLYRNNDQIKKVTGELCNFCFLSTHIFFKQYLSYIMLKLVLASKFLYSKEKFHVFCPPVYYYFFYITSFCAFTIVTHLFNTLFTDFLLSESTLSSISVFMCIVGNLENLRLQWFTFNSYYSTFSIHFLLLELTSCRYFHNCLEFSPWRSCTIFRVHTSTINVWKTLHIIDLWN